MDVASRAATSEGGRETGRSIEVETPDRLFSPLDRRIFDSVAQHDPCRKLENETKPLGLVEGSRDSDFGSTCLGRDKRLNCAPRGSREDSPMDLRGIGRGDPPEGQFRIPRIPVRGCFGSNCFFTESLILAQNERWRRV